jgi:hypothetical protein
MKNFESPLDFRTRCDLQRVNFEFSDLIEIAQGGPLVGILSINGSPISKHLFGGPILQDSKYVYAPQFVKRLCYSGFVLVRINIENFEIERLGKFERIVFLEKIADGEVYYFADLDKNVSKRIFMSKHP